MIRKNNLFTILILAVISMPSVFLKAQTVAWYRFETDGDQDVSHDQLTTSTSVIDDEMGNYPGTSHIPVVDATGKPLMYRDSFGTSDAEIVPRTGELNQYCISAFAQNYGSTDRWIELGQGTFDFLDSFTVECWVHLNGVFNYQYDEEQIWSFVDETTGASFSLQIGEETWNPSPPPVEIKFVHTVDPNDPQDPEDSFEVYSAVAAWDAGTDGWVHVTAAYDSVAGKLYLYYNGKPVAQADDNSGHKLGDGVDADWNYYLMGGQSDHGKTFYGAIDEVRISDRVLLPHEVLVSTYSDECDRVIAQDGPLAGDLNDDCYVDFVDFSIFAESWLDCSDPINPNCNKL